MTRFLTSSEAQIQKTILEWLHLQKDIYAIRINPVGIPLHGIHGRYRPSGMKGVSDIICNVQGKFLAMEVKRPLKGKLSKDQAGFLNGIKRTGGEAHVVTSLDEVILIINKIRKGN